MGDGRRGSVPLVLTGWEAATLRREGFAGVGESVALVGAIGCLLGVVVATVRHFVF